MNYQIKNIFDFFVIRTDNWTCAEFEKAILRDYPNEEYPFDKELILAADELGYWPKVIERYIRTNYIAHGNVSSELDRIANRILGADYKPSI